MLCWNNKHSCDRLYAGGEIHGHRSTLPMDIKPVAIVSPNTSLLSYTDQEKLETFFPGTALLAGSSSPSADPSLSLRKHVTQINAETAGSPMN